MNRKELLNFVIILLLITLAPIPIFAETIVLKSGETIEAEEIKTWLSKKPGSAKLFESADNNKEIIDYPSGIKVEEF